MQEWFSVVELVGFPGLPGTRRAILYRATNENWQSRERQGRGGGLEYHISSLPQETQRALAIKNTNETIKKIEETPAGKIGKVEAAKLRIQAKAEKIVNKNARLESMLKAEGLEGMAKDRMNAKLEIIKLWEEFSKSCNEGKTAAQHIFCYAYNCGDIQAPEWVRGVIAKTSQPSLMKWLKQARQEGITRLAGKYGTRKGSGVFDTNPGLYEYFLSFINEFPHCNAKQLARGISANLQRIGIEAAPSVKTVTRFLDGWKNTHKAEYEMIKNPDKYRGKLMPAFGNASEGITRYLQLWETDSTPTDVMLKNGRHTIIGVIDVASRRPKVLISKTSNSVSIGLLMRQAILGWGVPECIKTDNGTDYVSRHIVELLESLEIEHATCPPFTPQAKPHIERFFGTFTRELLELVPGYIGHSVTDRVDIEQRKSFAERISKGSKKKAVDALPNLTAAELQQLSDEWIENVYLKSPHKGLNGMSPMDFISEWVNAGNPVRRITDSLSVRALDYLLAEVPGNNGIRTIGKDGIEVDTFNFIAPELVDFIGHKVRVKYSPFDVGYVNVYWLDGEMLCVAQCPEITGASRAELAQIATEKSRQLQSEQKKRHKSAMRSMKTKNVAKEILQQFKDIPNKDMQPVNAVEYKTPALQQAADQIGAIDAMNKPLTVEEINASAQKVSPEAVENMAKIIAIETKRASFAESEERAKTERFRRYDALAARDFQDMSEDDERWLESWSDTPEGRVYIKYRDVDCFEANSK